MAPRSFLDFDVLFLRTTAGYQARVLRSPVGQASAEFAFPFNEREVDGFLNLFGRASGPRRGPGITKTDVAQTFGKQLVNAAFSGEVQKCLCRSLDRAVHSKQGLRILLRLSETPELNDLPWEFLLNPNLGPDRTEFLALSADTPIVRYVEIQQEERALAVTPPLRLLAVISSPSDQPQLDAEKEWSKVQEALKDAAGRGLLSLERMVNPTPQDLLRQLRQRDYHILHFIGHGVFDPARREGFLLFTGEDGRREEVSGERLGILLRDHLSLRLVVLNACEGARSSRADAFGGVAQKLVERGIPGVIAMQFEITDRAAVTFAQDFYDAVAQGRPVDAALAEARKALYLSDHELEWGTPVLYMRSPDGRLFDVQTAPSPNLLSRITQAFTPEGAESREQRNRETLLQRVRHSWIEGVLEQSIYKAALIEIGKEAAPEAVENPWEKVLEVPDRPKELVTRGKKTIDLFDEVGRELLVLGEPGSGKTMTLLELARDAVDRAESDPRQPIPVVFNLSSWGERRLPLGEWLVTELSSTYHIPPQQGREWVEKGDLLLLLDGLDEVADSHREDCVKAINLLLKEHGWAGVAVASRSEEYGALKTQLKLYAAVRLEPLSDQQVHAYLAAAGPGLAALDGAIDREPALQDLSRSPLMLSIMTLAFGGKRSGGQRDPLLTPSPDSGSDQLFSAYVSRMLERRPGHLASAEETRHRLGWLARKMEEHGRSQFHLEDLQPSWLADRKERWRYALISRLACGLVPVVSAIPMIFLPGFAQEFDGELLYGLIVALLVVMLAWLTLGVKDGFRFDRPTPWQPGNDKSKPSRLPRSILRGLCWSLIGLAATAWMLFCAGFAVLYGLFRFGDELITSLLAFSLALGAAGPAVALLRAWRRRTSGAGNDIQTTENLGWEWSRFLRPFFLVSALPALLIFAWTTRVYEPGIRLWESQTGDAVADLEIEDLFTPAIALSPDGSSIATGGDRVRVWAASNGRLLCQSDQAQRADKNFLAFSPDGQRLLTQDSEGAALLLNAGSCTLIAKLKELFGSDLKSIAFNRDGSLIAMESFGVSLWNGATGRLIEELEPRFRSTAPSFSPDGERVATGSSSDLKIRIWNARNGRLLFAEGGHESEIQHTAYNHNGTRLLTVDKSGALCLRNGQDGRMIAKLTRRFDFVTDSIFSPDGTRVLTISNDSNKLARLWDSRGGHLVTVLKGLQNRINSKAFSPDSNKIVTVSSDGTVRVWDGHTGEHFATLDGQAGSTGAMFSPDGRWIMAVAFDKTVLLWRTSDGRALLRNSSPFRRKPAGQYAVFTPDGSRLVTASPPSDLRSSALVWLLGGLLVAIFRGVRQWQRELKILPNEGMRLTARAAGLLGLAGGTMVTLTLLVILSVGFKSQAIWLALLSAFWFSSILTGLAFGGADVLQHLVLRLLLRRGGRAPWHYARFLDQAAEQILLRKVGGGYIFIHRLLLEHLARTSSPEGRL
ncbi:MAG: CHAT domain-containing protein [Acidobacteriota bacterium]